MNETFSSAALLVDVLRTLLNVSMLSHSQAVLSNHAVPDNRNPK